jgi:hypothetical protein
MSAGSTMYSLACIDTPLIIVIGASLQQLRKATGWQAHSVRGFLSGTLKKKMGLRVTSTKPQDGERTYRIVSK